MSLTSPASQFASDNNAGIAPAALAAMLAANATGHAAAYGNDDWTAKACDRIRALFETDCEVFFVFNGTAANALALAQLVRPFEAVVCHELAHIATDECGAPEFFTGGAKLITAATPGAKLLPETVAELATRRRDLHAPRVRALSLTQSTELGTVYGIGEVEALGETARRHGLSVHMDGARFANAVARLGCAPAAVTWRAGVDVLSFGGTKNGLPAGEAVVFFDKALAEGFEWRLKQAGQLNSKMRLVASAWLGLLDGDVWLANARQANAMASRLAGRIAGLDEVRIAFPVEANAVFVTMPKPVQAALLARGWRFYDDIGEGLCRLMCAWDTEAATVDAFADDIAASVTGRKAAE